MTESPVLIARGSTYVTEKIKRSPNASKSHRFVTGKKPMKQENKRTFKIPVTNVTIRSPGARKRQQEKN